MTPHLSEEELLSLLAPLPSHSGSTLAGSTLAGSTLTSEMGAHLAACDVCREEFHFLAQSLGNFRLAAMQFASMQPASMPAAPMPAAPMRLVAASTFAGSGRFLSLPRAAWAAGLVAAVALGAASVSILDRHRAAPPATRSAATLQQQNTSAQAQSDDALLESIDKDLAATVPPSLEPLDSAATGETSSTD